MPSTPPPRPGPPLPAETFPPLEGTRIRLRAWRETDLAPFAAMNADPAVMRHFAAPLSRAESDAMVARMQEHHAAHGWGFWCVEEIGGTSCIGMVGLQHVPWTARFTPAVEIGWRISTPFQRHGHAEEAARLSMDFGFATLDLPEIVAFTVPGNEPSWRLMEKLGMREDGVFGHPRLPEGHPLRLHRLYRMTRPA